MSKPVVALTFDDGPGPWTWPLLQVLERHDAKATFFVLGENIKGNEWLIEKLHAQGHELGVHGWDHTRFPDEIDTERLDGVGRTAFAIEALTGQFPRYWRAPWHYAPNWAVDACHAYGIHLLPVTVDGFDVARDEGMILDDLMAGLGHGAVIGLHDGIARNGSQRMLTRRPTVRAVDRLLEHCTSVTASELDRMLCG